MHDDGDAWGLEADPGCGVPVANLHQILSSPRSRRRRYGPHGIPSRPVPWVCWAESPSDKPGLSVFMLLRKGNQSWACEMTACQQAVAKLGYPVPQASNLNLERRQDDGSSITDNRRPRPTL
jgi:hypothetical protein